MKKVTTLSLLLIALNAFAQRISGPITEQSQRALPALPAGALFFEGFENGNFGTLSQNWTSSSLSNESFYTGISGNMEGQANENGFWPVPKHGIFAMTNDDVCNCDKSEDELTSKTFDLRGLEKVTFGFEAFQNGAGNQLAWVEFYTPETGWINVKTIPAGANWQSIEIELNRQYLTSSFQFRFRYSDQGNYASGLALDNIYLREGYLDRIKVLNYFTLRDSDQQSSVLYESMPLSQAKHAEFELAASVKNETENQVNMKLSSIVVGNQYDTSSTWSVFPNEVATLKANNNHRFTPTGKGNFIFTSQALAASNDSALYPISLAKLTVSDSLYYRVASISDGSGIWLQHDDDEIGTVFHLFKTDTLKAINIQLHAATEVNSTFRVLVYEFENLDSAIYESETQLISTQDFPVNFRVVVDSVFEKGKYVISVKRQSGNTVITTRQDKSAAFGEVVYKTSGWSQFAYFPFVSISFPQENENCKGTIVADIQTETCYNTQDASIDLSRSTFGMTSTVTWSNGASGLYVNNLLSGIYSVTVNDTNGCFYQKTLEIQAINQLEFNESITADLCSKSSGKIELNATGGTEPYIYSLMNEQINPTLHDLEGGNYEITLTDANGCTLTEIFNIQSSDTIALIVNQIAPDCGIANGAVSINASGTAPFTFLWENGITDSTLSSIEAGIYSITITDGLGCTKDTAVILNDTNAAVISAEALQPLCTNTASGAIDISLNGGLQPFAFVWSNDSTSEDLQNLTEGIYTVTVQDALGCKSYFSSKITASVKSSMVNLTAQGGLCGESGSIIKALIVDSTETSLSWNTGASTPEIENLSSGIYQISVTNAFGCQTIDSAEIFAKEAIQIFLDSTAYIIDSIGFNRALLFITITGGTPEFEYKWSNGFTEEDLVAKDTGLFTLQIIDQFGCAASWSTEVTAIPTGFENLSLKNSSIKTYPNPFIGNSFNIDSSEKIEIIKVHDISGRLINTTLSNSSNKTMVTIPENCTPGIYICTLQLANNQKTIITLLKLR